MKINRYISFLNNSICTTTRHRILYMKRKIYTVLHHDYVMDRSDEAKKRILEYKNTLGDIDMFEKMTYSLLMTDVEKSLSLLSSFKLDKDDFNKVIQYAVDIKSKLKII